MTLVYIRHAHDKKSHRAKLDDRLSDEGKKKARRLARKLIREHGVPTVIYCSPMYRTRQTAREFLKVIEKHQKKAASSPVLPAVVNDPRLGRFFTSKQQHRYQKHAHSLRKSTENVLLDNGKVEFRRRVVNQFQELHNSASTPDVVWNITHALVLLHVARINDVKRAKHVKYLDTLVINK